MNNKDDHTIKSDTSKTRKRKTSHDPFADGSRVYPSSQELITSADGRWIEFKPHQNGKNISTRSFANYFPLFLRSIESVNKDLYTLNINNKFNSCFYEGIYKNSYRIALPLSLLSGKSPAIRLNAIRIINEKFLSFAVYDRLQRKSEYELKGERVCKSPLSFGEMCQKVERAADAVLKELLPATALVKDTKSAGTEIIQSTESSMNTSDRSNSRLSSQVISSATSSVDSFFKISNSSSSYHQGTNLSTNNTTLKS